MDIHPAAVPTAVRLRCDDIAELVDDLRVDRNLPILADAISLHAGSVAESIHTALGNSAQGENVIPHLVATLDAIADELRALLQTLDHH